MVLVALASVAARSRRRVRHAHRVVHASIANALGMHGQLAVLARERLRTLTKVVVGFGKAHAAVLARLELVTKVDQLAAVFASVAFRAIAALVVVAGGGAGSRRRGERHANAGSARAERVAEAHGRLALEAGESRQTVAFHAVRDRYALARVHEVAASVGQRAQLDAVLAILTAVVVRTHALIGAYEVETSGVVHARRRFAVVDLNLAVLARVAGQALTRVLV